MITIRARSLLLAGLAAAAFPAGAAEPPREHFAHATVSYDFVTNARGEKLRTFVTQPTALRHAQGERKTSKVPAVFFVGWLSCDSVEYAAGETDGFGAFMRRVIDQSGYATVRMDKPGVGESEGHCDKADFDSELTGYQAAFDAMAKYGFIDTGKVFVIGISNGGGVSPLVARGKPVAGYVAMGSWGRTWYEHMLEMERGRLTRAGKPAGEREDTMRILGRFYGLYLVDRKTPGEAVKILAAAMRKGSSDAEHEEHEGREREPPDARELRALPDEITDDGQYGRPAAFYQQLQALKLREVWRDVKAPVLVIRGGKDTIMSRADSKAIADTVNAAHAGRARYVEVPGMSHLMTVNKKFHAPVVKTVLEWMKSQLAEH